MTDPNHARSASQSKTLARPGLLRGAGLQPHAWWLQGAQSPATKEQDRSTLLADEESVMPGTGDGDEWLESNEIKQALGNISKTAGAEAKRAESTDDYAMLDEDTADEEWGEDDDFLMGPVTQTTAPEPAPEPAPDSAAAATEKKPINPEAADSPHQAPATAESEPAVAEPAIESQPANRLKPADPIFPPRHRDLAAASGFAPASPAPTSRAPQADELTQLAGELLRATAKRSNPFKPAKVLPSPGAPGRFARAMPTSGSPACGAAAIKKPIFGQAASPAASAPKPGAPTAAHPATTRVPVIAQSTETSPSSKTVAMPKPAQQAVQVPVKSPAVDQQAVNPTVSDAPARPWWQPVLGLLLLATPPLLVWAWVQFGDQILPDRAGEKRVPEREATDQQSATERLDASPALPVDPGDRAIDTEVRPLELRPDDTIDSGVRLLEEPEFAPDGGVRRATPIDPESLTPIVN